MSRRPPVKARSVVRERIQAETSGATNSRIPLWNAQYDVECHQIRLPLNHLFLRLKNARTTDWQIAWLGGRELEHPLSGEQASCPDERIFESDRQFEQDAQDAQAFLLLLQANRRRENGKTLLETLRSEGWKPIEVPIITRSGVLINGNTRIAAIEAMIANGEEISGIDPQNPQIDVRIVPNEGNDEEDIEQLERILQKPDGVRLDYDWYQQTTVIRSRLANGEQENHVQHDYRDLERFKTIGKMRKTLSARVLVDEIYEKIGRKNQAILDPLNEHMLYAMSDVISKDYVTENPEIDSQAKALFSQMLQVTLEGDPQGEMRYHVTRIKKPEDINRFCEEIDEILPGSFVTEETDDGLGETISLWRFEPTVFTEAEVEDQERCALKIQEIAEDLKDRNAGLTADQAVLKRLKEAQKKIKSSREILGGLNSTYPNEEELMIQLRELGRTIREYLEWRSG